MALAVTEQICAIGQKNLQSYFQTGSSSSSSWFQIFFLIELLDEIFIRNILIILCINYTGRFIMYSGITKICYRKTVGHVFTKPVQIEGTTQKIYSQ